MMIERNELNNFAAQDILNLNMYKMLRVRYLACYVNVDKHFFTSNNLLTRAKGDYVTLLINRERVKDIKLYTDLNVYKIILHTPIMVSELRGKLMISDTLYLF